MATPQDALNLSGAEPITAPRPRRAPKPPAAPRLNLEGAEPLTRAPRASRPSQPPHNPYSADDYNLDGDWSPARGEDVKAWFKTTYGRDLPNSFGQTRTHAAMGLDHSANMDVQLDPQSDEGKSLREYLRSARIPFLAYYSAKPGAATGPHIHVGDPSHRGAAQPGPALNLEGVEPLDASGGLNLAGAEPLADPERDKLVEEYGEPVTVNASSGASPAPSAPPSLPRRATFDPRTQGGREARDARELEESDPDARLTLDVPLPAGKVDWSEVTSGDAARLVVREFAKRRNIPDVFVDRWLADNADRMNLHLYDAATGAKREPVDYISEGSPAYDFEKRTLRVSAEMPHLKQLEREYRDAGDWLERLGDFVSDDETSPGEKMLTAAGTVAAPVARGAGYVARPFTAASAGVWAATRGKNPLTEAGHVLSTGETTAAGENPIGNYLRDSAVLNRINPRLGRLLGGGADVILDPANLIGLGLVGKGARLVAGAGRLGRAAEEVSALGRSLGLLERGIVDARPLGLLDDAPEAAKLAKAAGFDTELVGAEGQRLVHSAATGGTVDLRTGEPVDLDAPSPAVQSEQLRYARERADYYAREAAGAKSDAARRNAQELADEYAAEAARLESGAPTEAAPDGIDVQPAPGTGPRPRTAQRPPWRRALSTARGVVQLPKAKAGFDLSAVGRQGLAQIAAHPTYFKQAMVEQVKAFASEGAFNEFVNSIRARPDFEQMQRSGLYLSHVAGDAVEEPFASGLAHKIPGVAASDRAYSAALDSIRVQAWDNYVSSLPAHLKDNPETLNAVADLINISTGRGKVAILDRSKLGRAFVDALNVPFFSPRNTASKFNLLSPARVVRNALNPNTRPVAWLQMRDAFRGLGTMGTTLGLAHLAGLDVGVDPRSSDFGKLRVGKAVYDLSGGEGFTVRYLASMARSFRAIEQGKKLKPREMPTALTLHYLRSQLQPLSSSAVDLATGETYEGKPATWTDAALNQVVPFVVEDALKGYHAEGWKGAVKSLPGVLGVGVNFYEKKGRGGARAESEGDSIGAAPTLEDLRGGRAAAVEVPAEVVGSADKRFVVPAGMRSFKTFDGGRVVYDPEQVSREDVVAAWDAGRLGELPRGLMSLEGVRESANVEDARGAAGASSASGRGGQMTPGSAVAAPHLMNLEGVRESTNVEDRRGVSPLVEEVQRAGASPVTETQAADAALLLEALPPERFKTFVRNLQETRDLGAVGAGAEAVFGGAARSLGAVGSKDAGDAAEAVRVLRVLARELRERPEQFRRDALQGKYGDRMREKAAEWFEGPFTGQPLRGKRFKVSRLEEQAGREGKTVAELVDEVRGLGGVVEGDAHDDLRRAVDDADAAPTFQEFPEALRGSNQFLSKLYDGEETPVEVIRLDSKILPLLLEMARFPSSGVDDASA